MQIAVEERGHLVVGLQGLLLLQLLRGAAPEGCPSPQVDDLGPPVVLVGTACGSSASGAVASIARAGRAAPARRAGAHVLRGEPLQCLDAAVHLLHLCGGRDDLLVELVQVAVLRRACVLYGCQAVVIHGAVLLVDLVVVVVVITGLGAGRGSKRRARPRPNCFLRRSSVC